MNKRLLTSLIIIGGFGLSLNAQSKIIFSRNPGELNNGTTLDLMMCDTQTKKTKILLKGTVIRRGEYNVTTSPDNSKIIFNTYRFRGWKLGIADFTGDEIRNVKRMTDRSNYEYNAMYSLDGKKIIYQEFDWDTDDQELFLANENGKNAIQFTDFEADSRTPCWTKNNKHIVFTSKQSWNYNIYIKSIDGTSTKKLTSNFNSDFAPSASSVEDKVAYLSDKEGNVNLYTMNLDGSDVKNLTSNLKSDAFKMGRFGSSGGWAYKTSGLPMASK